MTLDKEDVKYLISAIDRDVRAQGLIVTPRALRIAQILQAVLEPPAPAPVAVAPEPSEVPLESHQMGTDAEMTPAHIPPEEPPLEDAGPI